MAETSGVCVIVPKHQDGYRPKVIGMGLLVDDCEVVTCAHVVDQAIGVGWFDEPGDGVVKVCLPFADGAMSVLGKVDRERYYPPNRAEEGKLTDIAVVELAGPAPKAVGRTVLQEHTDDASVKVYGFRQKKLADDDWECHPDGEIVESKVLGRLPGGRVYFEGIRSTGAAVEPGFSGAGVYDPAQGAVVGMVVAATTEAGKSSAQFIDVASLYRALGRVPSQAIPDKRPSSTQIREVVSDIRPVRPEAAKSQPEPLMAFVGRKELLDRVLEQIKVAVEPGVQTRISLQGWPGVGKTTLATAAYFNLIITNSFHHLAWVQLAPLDGPKRDDAGIERGVLPRLAAALGAFGEDDISAKLGADRERSLIFVDDVWDIRQAELIAARCPKSVILITTREPEVAEFSLSENVIPVEGLDHIPALALLKQLCSVAVEGERAMCEQFLKVVEYLPLAINVIGKQLQYEATHGREPRELLSALLDDRRRVLEQRVAKTPLAKSTGKTIAAILRTSVDRLEPESRLKFTCLAAFANNTDILVDELAAVWDVSENKVATYADELIDRGLLAARGASTYFTHALLMSLAELLEAEYESYNG